VIIDPLTETLIGFVHICIWHPNMIIRSNEMSPPLSIRSRRLHHLFRHIGPK
jgi:hypothetical protein